MSNDWASPLWMQTQEYSAQEDRAIIERVADKTEQVVEGFNVTARQTGPNYSVDVGPGEAYIAGDDQPDQGFYLAHLLQAKNVPVQSAPSSGDRVDRIVVRVYDPQAGGASPPGPDPIDIEVIPGGASGPAPEPASSLTIALVTLSSGDAAVNAANITDARPYAGGRVWVETRAPTPNDGRDGDLWAVVP